MDINRRTLRELYVSFLGNFQRALRSAENANAWQKVATRIPSTTAKNVYPWLGQAPRMRKWLDDRLLKKFSANKYELSNDDFEMTVEVERNAILDDSYMVYAPLFEEMGVAAAEWPNDLVFAALKAGETGLGYDDKPFFAADHPHEIEGAVSNLQAGGAAPWYVLDTMRPLKPLIFQDRQAVKMVRLDRDTDTNVFNQKKFIYGADSRGAAGYGLWQLAHKSKAALDETNLTTVLTAMGERTNDAGSSLGIKGNLLVVPHSLEFAAKKLVQAVNNASGATNVFAGRLEVFVTDLVRE